MKAELASHTQCETTSGKNRCWSICWCRSWDMKKQPPDQQLGEPSGTLKQTWWMWGWLFVEGCMELHIHTLKEMDRWWISGCFSEERGSLLGAWVCTLAGGHDSQPPISSRKQAPARSACQFSQNTNSQFTPGTHLHYHCGRTDCMNNEHWGKLENTQTINAPGTSTQTSTERQVWATHLLGWATWTHSQRHLQLMTKGSHDTNKTE